MDFALARLNMVESQVRPSAVTDRGVIEAMSEISREQFVPEALKSLAYMGGDLAFGSGESGDRRFMLAPRSLAQLIQLAAIEPDDAVLDVGCATGYSTSVLARLARSVIGLECDQKLAHEASETLRRLGAATAVIVAGPLAAGHKAGGPYDAILLNGAIHDRPSALLDQLNENGRLVAIVDTPGGASNAHLYVRLGGRISESSEFDLNARPLPGFERKQSFVF